MAITTEKMKRRCLAAVAILLVAGFGLDLCRLFIIQIVNGSDYKAQAEAQQLRDTTVSADRGIIYDCNKNVLAQSASAWLVYVNPSLIENDTVRRNVADGLSECLGDITSDAIYNKIKNTSYRYVKIEGGLEYAVKEKISKLITPDKVKKGEVQKPSYYGIINIDPDTKRYYPYLTFASTVIGSLDSSGSGRSGLELQYNNALTGVNGRIVTAKNANSGEMASSYSTSFAAQQGTSLVLTIDKTIQYYLEKGLSQALVDDKASYAYGIVMNVETGAVLAMSTMPDFDLNSPNEITDKKTLDSIKKIPDETQRQQAYNNAVFSNWRNRVISDTYEPGSVFKLFTASAALEEGVITKNFSYTCTGSIRVAGNTIHCHSRGGHGTESLAEGLINSCNPFFVTVGQKLGVENFRKYFKAFGFTEPTGIDLPGEIQPVAGQTYHTDAQFGISELSSSAFGQSFQVSPMQIITGVSCIANGGKLMKPYVVQEELDQDGNTVYEAAPTVRRQVISESTSKTMLSMMERVVTEGTGKNAYIPGYRVAGKTGTSEKLTKRGKYLASFVGCAPADNPKIAVLIIIDEPLVSNNGGGAIAAPVAGSIIEQTLKYMNVEPVYTDKELAQLNASAPSVTGISVSEAKSQLQKSGFSARVIGSGSKVTSQYPAKGQTLSMNGVIILYTDSDSKENSGTVPNLSGLSISSANEKAVSSGFNIKISGASVDSEVVAYKQSIEAGTKAELGSTITVYFKTTQGVEDD